MARSTFSRRTFLMGAAGVAGAGLLSACGSGGDSKDAAASGTIKFWDTVWGPPEYVTTGKTTVNAYKSTSGTFGATYQSIDWANWYQTFSSAIASKTGPAVSSGASTQPYQFYDQGGIAPADNLYAQMEKGGTLADFVPSSFDILKYKGVLVGMPWAYDMRPYLYRPSLLEKAGVQPPTTWDELYDVGLKLKNMGISGYGVAPTPNGFNYQQLATLVLSNGGVFVDEQGNIACLSDRFIEGTEFLLSLSKAGIIRKDMVSYSSANLYADVSAGKTAIFVGQVAAASSLSGDAKKDLAAMSPIAGPSGDKFTAGSVQTLMMYTDTPSQQASEEFLTWYLDAIKVYWEKKLVGLIPVRKSITETLKESDPLVYKVGAEYSPLSKNWFGDKFDENTAKLDASPAITKWGQQIVQGEKSARSLCEELQKALEQVVR